MTTLYCGGNQLTVLDVSKNTALTELFCGNNKLTAIDVSKNTSLTAFWCYENQLTTLEVSKNTALKDLRCYSNQLTALDVSKNTALKYLYCNSNQLTALDVSKNTALAYIAFIRNKIKKAEMEKLISGLPQNGTGSTYRFLVINNSNNDEGNVCTKDQVAKVKAKGWTPEYYNGTSWLEYEGSDESDNIQSLTTANDTQTIFSISGQRLKTPRKGINIIGGKTVVIK